ncbi:hypothetical protein ONZ45_g10281 [Pleurotus djamor]|nr:hypothetical protein ONZ45_g10281 [Pleurotus djamor]
MPNTKVPEAPALVSYEFTRLGSSSSALDRLKDWSPRLPIYASSEASVSAVTLSTMFGLTSRRLYQELDSLRISQVHDKHAALGDSIKAVRTAFQYWGYDLSNLFSFSGELREVFDMCIDIDASPEKIMAYAPTLHRFLERRVLAVENMQNCAQVLLKQLQLCNRLRLRISDTYVALGNQFNEAVAALFTITDTSIVNEFFSALEDLRAILELRLTEGCPMTRSPHTFQLLTGAMRCLATKAAS